MPTRFVVISDTHFYAPGRPEKDALCWNRVLQTRTDAITQALFDVIRDLAPDFVLHCGDITGLCEMAHWEFACRSMDRLPCPWYAVLGNHDTWFAGVRDAFSARFGAPAGQCYYGRDLGGIRFLFLDVAGWYDRDGRFSPYLDRETYDSGRIAGIGPEPAQLAWLAAELTACDARGIPAVLVSHAPLGFRPAYPVATLPKGGQPASAQTAIEEIMEDIVPRQELRRLVAQHPCVRLALAGHWHINDAIRLDGVTYCQTASLREYPFEVRVAGERDGALAFRTVSLPDARLRAWSYLPEWRNEWVAGAAEDRTFTVALRAGAGETR